MDDDVAIRIRTTHPNGGAYALQGEQCGYDTTTCPLYDDGSHGDAFAGDHLHSLAYTVDTPLDTHDAYVFYRLDGDRTLPVAGSLGFDTTGSCPLYLLAQGNPYGITVTDCDAYAHVTCDTGGSSFGPVSFIGNEDFAAPAERLVEEGTTLDLRVEIFAPGLTDGGTATAGEAISVSLETRQWDAAAQDWGAWTPHTTAFSFETDDGANWQYLLENVSLPVGIHELRSTYTDWAGNTGTTGANIRTVFVSDPATTPHAIHADGDPADWRANERHDGLDGAESYVTWDDRFIYAAWLGGSGSDRCIAGFDLNLGTADQVAPYAGAEFSGDLTLTYTDGELNGNEETALHLYRWTGTAWQLYAVAGGDRDTAANRLTVRNVSGFSDWIIADGIPTAVALVDFRSALNWEIGFAVAALLWAAACIARLRRHGTNPSSRTGQAGICTTEPSVAISGN